MVNSNYFKKMDGLNCAEYLLRGVANYYNRDFELMYLGAWGLDIDFGKEKFDNGFVSECTSDPMQYLEMFHGLQVDAHFFHNYSNLEEFIQNELSRDMPVMVTVDLYWVPWTTQHYLQLHWGHEILIVGKTLNGWLCYDMFNKNKNLMPFENIEKCFCRAQCFQLLPIPQVSLKKCIKEVKYNIQKNLVEKDSFKKLDHLSELFFNPQEIRHDILENKISLPDFQRSDLMETFNRISQTRSQYALMLRYLASKFESTLHLGEVADSFDQISAMWKNVWGMLQKAYLISNKDPIIIRIGHRLNELSQLEKTASELLLHNIDHFLIL